ncbi:MAG: hypothetical protein LBD22_02795 [Spirochaetaceae bacterium]|nr:hypothetical protein [Spirochaetaceae bacterium]
MKQIKNTVCAVFALVVTLSCSDDSALDNLLGGSASIPLYSGYKVVSGKQIDFYFSTDVQVLSARLQPEADLEPLSEGNAVSLMMKQDRSGGERFIADILVEDPDGNTLEVIVPFRTRNDRVPRLVINEIKFSYGDQKSEFIEFKVLEAGNLGALRLFIVSADPFSPVYEFPPVEVTAGEYIILHMRTLDVDTAVDELGKDLTLSSSLKNECPKTVRDLWLPIKKKLLHNTDVIYLMDQDSKIIEGVVLCEIDDKNTADAVWKKNKEIGKAAELLAKQGQWLNKDGIAVRTPQWDDAAITKGNSGTRTLCRDEDYKDSNTQSDWYICKKSGATPGAKNDPERYVP